MVNFTFKDLKLNFSPLLTIAFVVLLQFSFFKVQAQSPGGVGTVNLKMWLKADAGTSTTTNGTALSTWTDQSPDARSATQGTAASRPTFYNTTNLINFNPAINFDGTEDMTFSSTGLPSGNSTRFLFAVATANGTAGSNQWIFSYGTQTAGRNFSIGQQGGTNNPFNGMWGGPADVIQTGSAFSSVPLIINGGFTAGTTLSITSNQRASETKTNNTINTQLATPAYIGRSAGGGITERWNGMIAEVICYNGTPSVDQNAQINTYLAIKYGISLDATAAINYRSSNPTIIWNYTTNAGYNNDIAGVGRDDNSGLNQKQSKSVNTDDLVTIGLGSIAATNADNTNAFGGSNRFFIWGNNNGATNAWSTTEAPSCFKRIAREWKVQETGSIGNCKYRVPESGAATNLPGALVGPVYMLVDGDGDFSAGATPYLMTKVGNNWEVDADLSSGQYFTFATSLATSVLSGNATICYGASTNLSIALTGTAPWSLTYSDGLTPVSVTGIASSPYVVSVTPLATSTYTVTALSAGGCTSSQAGDRTGSAAITVNSSLFQLSSEDIIAYYKFNGNANDETKKNQGTLQNAPTLTTDRFGIANSAYSLNGTNQYITTTNSFTDPNIFSFSIWFNTSNLIGGKLVSFGSSATGSSTDFDRHIYMSNTGKLNLGINPVTSVIVSSPLAYNDGNWHMATATVGAAGMKLYVDGS
ncbi:MAG: hypothetical protein K0R51_3063, partial [Cytophagaceae bacterium]|nr:hypothetical protein [Cytophagaceae bacterium]